MDVEELWNRLVENEISRNHSHRYFLFRWDFVSLSEADFQQFEPYFTKQQVVAWNNFENLRSKHWYIHIHAVRQKEGEISIHRDRFNPTVHWLLSIPHGFTDALPYFLWCLISWQKPYTI